MQQVALITGASRGIGRGVAIELAAAGYAVTVNFVRNGAAAGNVVEEVENAGGRAIACQGDVSRADDRQRLLQACLDTFGRLDLLVNNAGITSPGRPDLLEVCEDNYDQVFATNLKGPFFLAQAAARQMIAQRRAGDSARACLVNISSISAYAASTNRADYCMAKSALEMMTWLFADRLAEFDIGVFDICPGVIESDMTGPVREKYDRLIADGLTPIRRWGTPADVARAVAAVASGAFPFTTGQRIHVDGGFHIRRL